MLLIAILIVIFFIMLDTREGLVTKPNKLQKVDMANQIMSAASDIKRGINLSKLRQSIPWMDTVIYEDLRNLIRHHVFDLNHIIKVLS